MIQNSTAFLSEQDLNAGVIAAREGFSSKWFANFDQDRDVANRIAVLTGAERYGSPRHKHTFQQIRYLVEGSINYGKSTYQKGDLVYIPEGVSYGPMKPPPGRTDGFRWVDMQFQGPSGIPYPEPRAFQAARAELIQEGRFENGVYIDAEGDKEDAFAAILQRLTGEPVSYPTSPLQDIVVVRTPEVAPVDHPEIGEGVSIRHLLYLFGWGPNIMHVSLPAGCTLPEGWCSFQQSRYLLQGSVRLSTGEERSALGFAFIPPDTRYPAATAVTDAELLVVQWDTPGRNPLPWCRL